jgi:hypothetical protein
LILEKFAEAASVPYPCKHRSNGCQQRLPKPQLTIHEDACIWRKIDCPVMKKECKHEVVTYGNVLNHLEQHHDSQRLDTNNSREALVDTTMSRDHKEMTMLRIVDNTLLVTVRLTESALVVFARHVPGTESNIRYATSIISAKGLIFSYGGPTIEIGSDGDEATDGPCLFLTNPMLKHLVPAEDNASNHLNLKVYVKWSGEINEAN